MWFIKILAPVFLHLFQNYLLNKAQDAQGMRLYYELAKYMGDKGIIKTEQRQNALTKIERIKQKWAEEARKQETT